jgi:transposase-like protein
MKRKRMALPQGETVPAGTPRRSVHTNGYVLLEWDVNNDITLRAYEHRVVLGNPKGGQVHHKNHIRTDNRPENLEWCESAAAHHQRHIRFDDATAIAMYQSGSSTTEIGRRLGVNNGNVSRRLRQIGVVMRPSGRGEMPSQGPRGARNGRSKLTEAAVREIRAMSQAGARPHQIARRFGVTNSNIALVLQGKSWKHVA